MGKAIHVLLADDEPSIRLTLGDALAAAGFQVTRAKTGSEAMSQLDTQLFEVVVSDIRMPEVDGLQLFERLRRESPATEVILMTAFGDVGDAVAALKQGAADYLLKPFDTDEVVLRVQRMAERRELQRELDAAREALSGASSREAIVGQSPPIVRLRDRIGTIGASEVSVVITGESGTGKELVARALHEASARQQQPFVAVNCAAFPETLIEAELFGHEAGAYTGAVKARAGRFKAAHGGTLFLDEVGEIPLQVQVKLLRALQEGSIEPLGSDHPTKVDVRILCATNRDLKQLVAEGRFRGDLYYRLKVLDIHVPPLRERKGDLPLLVEHFARQLSNASTRKPTITPRAWAALAEYAFPGNVRELEHAVQHAVVLAGAGEIDLEHLPEDITGLGVRHDGQTASGLRPLTEAARLFEREYLTRALREADGKKGVAAKLLGISRKTLWEKMKSHGLTEDDD
jgi:DNA-binding NtrC family response regulator